MKRCGYCGRENTDDATECCDCGTSFVMPSVVIEEVGWNRPALARNTKRALILTAWGLALLALCPFATTPLLGPLVIVALPSGLWGFFTEKDPKSWNILAGWVFYALVVTVLMRAKSRPLFVCIYAVLFLALILNVVGCYKVAESLGRGFH